jgi:hypothetical protein
MHLHRLFNVLVLGGAALALAPASCDERNSEEGGSSGDSGESEDGETGPGESGESSSSTTGGDQTDESGSESGDGTTESGDGTSEGTGDATESETGDVMCMGDPFACGCPCCWVADCVNTEDCCAGWCGECC